VRNIAAGTNVGILLRRKLPPFSRSHFAARAILLASSPMRSISTIALATPMIMRKSPAVGWRRAITWLTRRSSSISSSFITHYPPSNRSIGAAAMVGLFKLQRDRWKDSTGTIAGCASASKFASIGL